MARKTNHAYFQKAAHNAYLKVKEQLGLTDDMPETLKVNILLDAGVEYMEMVSFMDDRLKDSHRQVKNIVKVTGKTFFLLQVKKLLPLVPETLLSVKQRTERKLLHFVRFS